MTLPNKKRLQTPFQRGFLLLIGLVLLSISCNEQHNAVETISKSPEASNPIAPGAFESSTIDSIEAYFNQRSASGRFSGVVLLQNGSQRFMHSYGYRHLRLKDSLELDDQFQLASLTKPITAFGVLTLVQSGKLDLDEYVTQYLYDFPYPEVTVRSLLSHTSGLGNYIYITDSLWNNPDSFMSNHDMYNLILCDQLPVYYVPHKRFNYCNTNYALLPILIEAVSGQSFEAYMENEVFEPLGMNRTTYIDPFERTSEDYDVIGHYPNGDPKRPFYLNSVIGDKGLYSTLLDLASLYQELRAPTLISQQLMNEATCPQVYTSNGRFYGLGWRIRPMEQDTMVFHNGWWRGFRSYFWMTANEEKLAIILTNSIRGGYLNQDEVWALF